MRLIGILVNVTADFMADLLAPTPYTVGERSGLVSLVQWKPNISMSSGVKN